MRVLVTGCAGFIGFHTCIKLLSVKNINVFGIDNLNKKYDTKLKNSRLKILKEKKEFFFYKIDIQDQTKLNKNFLSNNYNYIIHLAAFAGVRDSIYEPKKYLDSNIVGFFNLIECAKNFKIQHFIYASTSSVYGDNKNFPSKENSNTNNPLSFYAATKKCNEIIAHSYSNIYKLPTTGLRFFTVYGPYGRPDMAIYKFTDSVSNKTTLDLYNYGKHYRDFTYIDDISEALFKLLKKTPKKKIPYSIYNVASGKTVKITNIVNAIIKNFNNKPKIRKLDIQKGDIKKTHGNIRLLSKMINYKPKTSFKIGIEKFILWYKKYYNDFT